MTAGDGAIWLRDFPKSILGRANAERAVGLPQGATIDCGDMSPPEGFTRRICAVLLADVSGYSALVGKDDERTAEAVERLHQTVCAIVADAGGQAEPRAGDAILATFDSVVAAVDSGLAILRRIDAEEYTGTRLEVRIGVHLGDVLVRDKVNFNLAVGDAINIAARLQALAEPGTMCVSDGVYRHVREKRQEKYIDLGRQQLKNISDPVHAYLIVPREHAAAHRPRTWRRGVRVAGALLAVAAVAAIAFYRGPWWPAERPRAHVSAAKVEVMPVAGQDQPAQLVTLGVMGFRNVGGSGAEDWRCDALRDGINTQLSRLSQVKVYSKEFIDFLITRKGLTEIEAASQLGIRKMVSGSVVSSKGALQIELHVVDVDSGVLELSYTTSGDEDGFLDLRNKLALDVIARLNLPVSDAERQVLLAQQSTDVEALRLLLEAEHSRAGGSPTPADPQSRTWTPGAIWWRVGGVALAESVPPESAIRDLLDRYRRAMEDHEIAALAGLYVEFPPEIQVAHERYFENVRDLHVDIDNVDIAVVGDEAVVSYTRTDDFSDVRSGRSMHVAVRVTKVLRQVDGVWKLTTQ